MKNKLGFSAVVCLFLLFAVGFVQDGLWAQSASPRSKAQLEAMRSGKIFFSLLEEANNLYVDSVDVPQIFERGVNAMLSGLDPYTVYIKEADTKDFHFMTTGEYGGIGAYIQERDSAVYVANPMPGTPAEKAGLKVGDKFLKIDGKSVEKATASEVSKLLKGPIGTSVEVSLLRLGEKTARKLKLLRENVVVDQVAYKGVLEGGVAYIRLSSFTDKSAQNVRNAFRELEKEAKLKGLVLDLRGNGGGLLDGAIDILSLFLPPKELLLYTKGKSTGSSQKYYSSKQEFRIDLPIVVLINAASASSAEIVAGTLQDKDRAVLVGTQSFGKGLVQTTRPLPYNGLLKVTVSRYYIPSGRCIQQLDYSHRNPDGSVAKVPDSLAGVFHTAAGREVLGGGGIRPEVEVEDEKMSALLYDMVRQGELFAYANELFLRKAKAQSYKEVVITDEDIEGLLSFLEEHKFKYGEQSLKLLEGLEKLIEFEGYEKAAADKLAALKKVLKPALKRDIEPIKPQLKSFLRGLLAAHYFGAEAQYAVNIHRDPSVKKAVEILLDPKKYKAYLSPKTAANEQTKP